MGAVMIRVFAQRYKRDQDYRFVVATGRVNNGYRVHVIDLNKALRSGISRTEEHADENFLKLEQALLDDGWVRHGTPKTLLVTAPQPGIRTGWVQDGWMEKNLIPAVVVA